MAKYIAKRLLFMLLALFLIATLTFFMMHAIPGGPFTSDRKLPAAVEAQLAAKYKLDQPVMVQYLDYMKGLLRLDLGPSFKYEGITVNRFIREGFPVSARIGLITVVFCLTVALPLGIVAALKNGKWQDMLTMFIATLGVTIPSFVIASLLMYVFVLRLGWLNAVDLDSWKGYVMPVIALGGYWLSYLAKMIRSSLLEVMGQDYIRTARAKGLSEFKVVTRHALRNALIPSITVLGPTIAGLLTGSFVIEKIFAIPGLGQHFVNAISNRDYTLIMGVTVFYASLLIVMTFVVDIVYCIVDPRIKLD